MRRENAKRILRGLGLLCADHAPEELQAAMASFLAHPERLQELGAMLISATEYGLGGVYCHEALNAIYAEYEKLVEAQKASD